MRVFSTFLGSRGLHAFYLPVKYKTQHKRPVILEFQLLSPGDIETRCLAMIVSPSYKGCGSLKGLKQVTCLIKRFLLTQQLGRVVLLIFDDMSVTHCGTTISHSLTNEGFVSRA